jgi:hypothetical protein
LASVGVEIVISDIGKGAGEERHEEGRPEADPIVMPPSTTAPATNSPARTSTDELVRTDEVLATGAAGNQATTTGVVGEETIPPQQTQSSKSSTVKHFSYLIIFVFLNLILSLISPFSTLSDPPPTDEMDVDITIEVITKDAAEKASKISTDEAIKVADEEAAKATHEEVAKNIAEEGGNKSAEATDDISVSRAPSADSAMRTIITDKAAADDHPSTSEVPLSSKYLKVGKNLFVSIPGTSSIGVPTGEEDFDDEVITATGLEIVDEPRASSNESKEQ